MIQLRAVQTARPGYSLLEIIVVVAILGLAASVSVPSVGRMVEAQQAREVVGDVRSRLNGVRMQAFTTSKRFDADAVRSELENGLAVGWYTEVSETLVFRGSGTCSEGIVSVVNERGRRWRLSVANGNCAVSLIN